MNNPNISPVAFLFFLVFLMSCQNAANKDDDTQSLIGNDHTILYQEYLLTDSERLHLMQLVNSLNEEASSCTFLDIGPYAKGEFAGLYRTNIRVYHLGNPESRWTIPVSLNAGTSHKPQIYPILELVKDCVSKKAETEAAEIKKAP